MGSSSSRPQYYYPYPQTGYQAQGDHPYPVQGQGQFGYYMQRVGNDPSQVQAIPGYYYQPAQTQRRRPAPKKHHSAPPRSNAQPQPQSQLQSDDNPCTASPGPSKIADPAPPAEPPAEPAGSPEAVPEAPADAPSSVETPDEPVEHPEAAAAAAAPAQQGLSNPLPSPPKDVFDTDPYRHLRRAYTTGTTGSWRYHTAPVAAVSYKPHLRSQYRYEVPETLRPPRPHEELKAMARKSYERKSRERKPNRSSGGPLQLLRSLTIPSFSSIKLKKPRRSPTYSDPNQAAYAYIQSTSASRGGIPATYVAPASPPTSSGPPITIPLSSPLNPTSLHRILYKKKLYPTAAHLFEAQKFMKHNPELAEQIRTSSENAAEMSMLSRAFETAGKVRQDWALVWRDKMDEALYMKFTQHPDLRGQLMATGHNPLLDGNEIPRPDGEGVNELGKALVRLRERLRKEGAR